MKRRTSAEKQPAGGDRAAFVARLKVLIDRAGSALALAKAIGVSDSTIHLWISGSEPSREKLWNLAESANVSLEWLVAGRGEMSRDAVPQGYALVKRGIEEGGEYEGVDYLALKIEWIRSLPGAPEPYMLFLSEAVGDAMSPTIESGDLVLINTKDRDIRDGIWAMASRGKPLILRRLRSEGGDKFRALCDNPAYQNGDPVGGQANVIGRVIWSGGKIP
jgi:phage repressor protein C with HTH and peptisase S24 domain